MSTVPNVQSLLLMVAWVETPGGGLRGRTGMPHACVEDSPVAFLHRCIVWAKGANAACERSAYY